MRQATCSDVDTICDSMMDNFAYVYKAIFNTNFCLTKEIFRSILTVNQGNFALGYKVYNLAFDTTTGEFAGLIVLNSEQKKQGLIIGSICSALILIRHIGIIGLIRTLKNIYSYRAVFPKVLKDEEYIAYIAVPSNFRRQGIGQQLVNYAIKSAKLSAKSAIILDVREKNIESKAFFEALLFEEESPLDIPENNMVDVAFGMGRSIRMKQKLL
jgi:ribosomal protein S18 acetylase RimI-like enzyme